VLVTHKATLRVCGPRSRRERPGCSRRPRPTPGSGVGQGTESRAGSRQDGGREPPAERPRRARPAAPSCWSRRRPWPNGTGGPGQRFGPAVPRAVARRSHDSEPVRRPGVHGAQGSCRRERRAASQLYVPIRKTTRGELEREPTSSGSREWDRGAAAAPAHAAAATGGVYPTNVGAHELRARLRLPLQGRPGRAGADAGQAVRTGSASRRHQLLCRRRSHARAQAASRAELGRSGPASGSRPRRTRRRPGRARLQWGIPKRVWDGHRRARVPRRGACRWSPAAATHQSRISRPRLAASGGRRPPSLCFM